MKTILVARINIRKFKIFEAKKLKKSLKKVLTYGTKIVVLQLLFIFSQPVFPITSLIKRSF